MAGTDEPSPLEGIQLNDISAITNTNGPTSLDLGNNEDLSEFGTPLNTFEAPKTPNITDNGDYGASTAAQVKTSRVLFTDAATDTQVHCPKITAICDVNKTPDHVPKQPDLGSSPRARNIARTIELHEPGFENGYDSDGDIGPFWDAIEDEGEQEEPLYEEEEATLVAKEASIEVIDDNDKSEQVQITKLAATTTTEFTMTPMTITNNDTTPRHVAIGDDLIDKMLRPAISIELRKRSLSVKGLKEELQARLKQAMKDKVPVAIGNNSKLLPKKKKNKIATKVNATKVNAMKKKSTTTYVKDFPEGCYWRPLLPSSTAAEPANPTFKLARAPTVPEDEAANVTVKWDFAEKFARPVFLGRYKRLVMQRNGRQKMDTSGLPLTESVLRKKGMPDPEFVKKHRLSVESTPTEFVEVFIPYFLNPYNGKPKANRVYPSIQTWTEWTNKKAMLACAGAEGAIYEKDWHPFTMKELRQHLGLYILNGLSPSPHVEWKFKPQSACKTHGSDFVYQAFGPNAARRHRHFKCFFTVQDPSIHPPSRKKRPNWKVWPLICWLNYITVLAWLLGVVFSADEQTQGFQGNHADKKRITYKAEGDGFQCDALCQDGWTHQVYFRNDPAPPEYLKMGLSPLHARVLWLFACVKDRWHICGLDNLYNSAKFCRVAFVHSKVLLNGVTRKGMRGLPKCVLQEEKKKRSDVLAVRGTVKAAVLCNDPELPDLVASSVYDTKPVHFLSTCCESIKWIVKERLTFNVDTGKTEIMRFLRLNQNDFYNFSMGSVDVSDQLRTSYPFDHSWLRNRKWWWSLLFWWFGVMLVNVYIYYVTLNVMAGRGEISSFSS